MEKFKKNKERDKKNLSLLKKMGWKVIIFWECQLKNGFEKCVKKMKKNIEA